MKIALTMLCALPLAGCSADALPTYPDLPHDPPLERPVSPTWLWGMVVDDTGVCIPGATVTVVKGQGLGQSITQRTPCDAWAYDGGFIFSNLTPGVAMTLRSSAVGYAAEEKTVVPHSGPQMAVLFTPARIR